MMMMSLIGIRLFNPPFSTGFEEKRIYEGEQKKVQAASLRCLLECNQIADCAESVLGPNVKFLCASVKFSFLLPCCACLISFAIKQ